MGKIILTILTTLTMFIQYPNPAFAGEKLNKQEIMDLLSGNTVNGYFMKQKQSILTGRVNIRIKFFSDGTAEKYTQRPKEGNFTEKGSWFVNKRGKFCVKWQPENNKLCGQLERAPDGTYELFRKNQKIIYEEIIPGT